jgi:hypothetical protein
LELLASPIPRGKPPTSGWKISQGELFRFAGPGMSIQDWMQARRVQTDELLFFTDPDTSLDSCLVKVSCRSVHNSLVSLEKNWQALAKAREQMTPGVSTVLVACAILSDHCHVTFMRDISHLSIKGLRIAV